MLCHLYAQLGTDLLTKLKGDFAFVLYNAKLVRPLRWDLRERSPGPGQHA